MMLRRNNRWAIAGIVAAVVMLGAGIAVYVIGVGPRGAFRSLLEPGIERGAPSVPATETTAGPLGRGAPLRPDPAGIEFDAAAAIAHARTIAGFGVREGGSPQERKAAEYIADQLRSMGYEPRLEEFDLPSGRSSVNVIATLTGADSDRMVIVGGHMDSKPPSPGANDNGSGCGIVLELARQFKAQPPPATVEFIFWGAEEFLEAGEDSHHLGSRHHAASLSAADRRRIAGVVSVDMVGVGDTFLLRTMNRGPQSLRRLMQAEARRTGVQMSYLRDTGATGMSDHEPYELRGLPVAWFEWHDDPAYHTAGDTADRLQTTPVRTTGRFLARFLYGLDAGELRGLTDR